MEEQQDAAPAIVKMSGHRWGDFQVATGANSVIDGFSMM